MLSFRRNYAPKFFFHHDLINTARFFSTLINIQETYAHTFSNQHFHRLNVKLDPNQSYTFNFDDCSFDSQAIHDLESLLMNYNVQGLSFCHETAQSEEDMAIFLNMVCITNLKLLDLSGIALTQNQVILLENNLRLGAIEQLKITVFSNTDMTKLRQICVNLKIELHIFNKPALGVPKLKHLQELTHSSQRNTRLVTPPNINRQGGFYNYTQVKTVEALTQMEKNLSAGFCFTVIKTWSIKNQDHDSPPETYPTNTPTILQTDYKNKKVPRIKAIIFSTANERGFVVSFEDFSIRTLQHVLKNLFEDPNIPKSCRSYRRNRILLNSYGIFLDGVCFDSSSALKQWNPNCKLRTFTSVKKLFFQFRMNSPMTQSDADSTLEVAKRRGILLTYASNDYRLKLVLTRLLKRRGDYSYYCDITLPLEKLLSEIEIRGHRIDYPEIIHHLDVEKNTLAQIEKNLAKVSTVGSPCDLTILDNKKNQSNEILRILTEIVQQFNPKSCRIYPQFGKFPGLRSLRSLPDLNTVLIYRPSLYTALLPELDKQLFAICFDSLPLRVLAQLSRDPLLVTLCKKKHSQAELEISMNSKLFENPEFIHKTSELNRYATGLISLETLTDRLQGETEKLLNRYYDVFPLIKNFHKSLSDSERGPSTEFGLLSRRKKAADLTHQLKFRIWGTTKDYICIFTIKLADYLKTKKLKSSVHSIQMESSRILLNLCFEEKSSILDMIKQMTQSIIKWSVPVKCTAEEWQKIKAHHKSIAHKNILREIPACQFVHLPKTAGLNDMFSPSQGFRSVDLQTPLQQYFGLSKLKPLQEEAIRNLLENRDTIVILPTGYGKSLCFQLTALLKDGMTIVVSPLISLIENQLDELHKKNIVAVWLKTKFCIIRLQSNSVQPKLLYLTPEMLCVDGVLQVLQKQKIAMFVVDEVHCIHSWGRTFRSAYRGLGCIKSFFPNVPILALSASVTMDTLEDISRVLKIDTNCVFVGTLARKNLFIRIEVRTCLETQLFAFLDRHPNAPGIIYSSTKNEVEKLEKLLNTKGYSVKKYHAGLSRDERSAVLHQFINDQCLIIVATVAFGMGVNKRNIRFIVHTKLPDSIERFYQETGRAGRDGNPSECLLLYAHSDFVHNCHVVNTSVDQETENALLVKINQMYHFCITLQCRQEYIAKYFNDFSPQRCNNCDVCSGKVHLIDGTSVVKDILRTVLVCYPHTDLNYIARILCNVEAGSQRKEHVRTSTFGCLSELQLTEVKRLLAYLVYQGTLSFCAENNCKKPGSLLCNETSLKILEGEQIVKIPQLQLNKNGFFNPGNKNSAPSQNKTFYKLFPNFMFQHLPYITVSAIVLFIGAFGYSREDSAAVSQYGVHPIS
jgi:ATP-dependent DNA helicase RecQ